MDTESIPGRRRGATRPAGAELGGRPEPPFETPGSGRWTDRWEPTRGDREPPMTYTGALILSGSIGRGHDSVAVACRAALGGCGLDADTVDCMSLLGGAGSRLGTAAFRRLVSAPTLYDGFHFSHLRTGSRLARALDRAASHRLVPAVRAELGPGRQLLVSVFPSGVAAAAAVKRTSPETTTVTVCTDASAHRMWVAEGTDLYVVCSPLAAATLRRYDAGAPISVVPPPVRSAFFDAPDRGAARRTLGVPSGEPCVLLMAGGWGLGPLAQAAEALVQRGYWVLAVAGANQRLESRLAALARRYRRLVAFGTTDRVPDLMAAADGVVTTPGQTCHEARVVGRWLVILDVVPGHGRENALHELETGAALACSPDAGSVTGTVGAMMDEQPEIPPWPVSSAQEWDKHFIGALASVGVVPS